MSAAAYFAGSRLVFPVAKLTRSGIVKYLGKEIPNHGLNPDGRFHLFRSPEELARAAARFALAPLLFGHAELGPDGYPEDQVIGAVGTDIAFVPPFLVGSLAIWNWPAIQKISSGETRAISGGYHFKVDMTPGHTPTGEYFDGRIFNTRCTHVALCEHTRAGADVCLPDPFPTPIARAA